MFCESRPFTLVLSLETVEKQHLHEKNKYSKISETLSDSLFNYTSSWSQYNANCTKNTSNYWAILVLLTLYVSYSYRLRSNVFICLDKIILSVSPNCTLRLARTAQVWLIRQKQIGPSTSWSRIPKMIQINTSGLIAALWAWNMCTSHKNEMT